MNRRKFVGFSAGGLPALLGRDMLLEAQRLEAAASSRRGLGTSRVLLRLNSVSELARFDLLG
jgi:hypothetical protein